jgi:hypothetical protein
VKFRIHVEGLYQKRVDLNGRNGETTSDGPYALIDRPIGVDDKLMLENFNEQ